MTHILQRLHDSGIRFEIYNIPHRKPILVEPKQPGVYWKLGCSLGLAQWEDGWTETIDGAVMKLVAAVMKRYPDCEFAHAERAMATRISGEP